VLGGESGDEAVEAAGNHEAVEGEELAELLAASDEVHGFG
jgi:hypothetical protein